VPALARDPALDAAADTLTIRACLALARERAPALLAAHHDQQAAARESTAVARERGPDWAVTSDATVAPAGFYDPTVTNLGEYDLKLGFTWPLKDGGKRMLARSRSTLDLSAARFLSAQVTRDVGLRAAELAADLLRLQEIASAQLGALEWTISLGSLVRHGVAGGMTSAADSIRIGLERDTAASSLQSTLQESRTDELELLQLIGRDPSAHVVIAPPAPGSDRPPDAQDSLRLLASADRMPEIALAQITEARGSLDLIEARRRNAATLDLAADAGLAGADLTSAVPRDLRDADPNATLADRLRRDLGASVAFHFRLPVLDRSAARHRLAKSESLRAAQARSAAERETQRRLALDLLSQWRHAYARLELATRSREHAEDALLRVKSLYAAGATTLLDLLDARRVAEETRERLAEARRDSRLAQARAEDRK
jgi:outer membrane protein TolC